MSAAHEVRARVHVQCRVGWCVCVLVPAGRVRVGASVWPRSRLCPAYCLACARANMLVTKVQGWLRGGSWWQ